MAAAVATLNASSAKSLLSFKKPINPPWRKLTRDSYVIVSAVKDTARCGVCKSNIKKGEIKLGVFYMHEDKFTLVRWYHRRCVIAPECLKNRMDLCGIEDLRGDDLEVVFRWLGVVGPFKERVWPA